jgi:hypothetical protein
MRRLSLCIIMALILAACNNVPATVVVLVTNTPDPNVIQVTVTPAVNPDGTATESSTPVPTIVSTTVPTTASATQPTNSTSTPIIVTIARPSSTPDTLDPNRQPIRTDLYVAQEDFEHGYMFWFSGKNGPVIWVLFITDPNKPNVGEWQSFADTWKDGEAETDPNIVPPDEAHIQPKRGFGKLWRTEPRLREALGWATTPEYELTTTYTYQPNGFYNDKNEWVPQPGDHTIISLSRQTFVLTEPSEGQVRGTWKKLL